MRPKLNNVWAELGEIFPDINLTDDMFVHYFRTVAKK